MERRKGRMVDGRKERKRERTKAIKRGQEAVKVSAPPPS